METLPLDTWQDIVRAPNAASLAVLQETGIERIRQNQKWGEQHHPDGTTEDYAPIADAYRDACKQADAKGEVTWHDILLEEVFEGMAEVDPVKLRAELVQIAAVAAAWIEDIDSRGRLVPEAMVHAGLEYIQRVYGKGGSRG